MNSKGMLGVKVGMTQLWDENNKVIPVTVIKCDPCHISQIKTNERDGYSAIQLAMGSKKEKNISGGEKGHLKAAGIESARKLVEIRVGDISEYELGQSISVEQVLLEHVQHQVVFLKLREWLDTWVKSKLLHKI